MIRQVFFMVLSVSVANVALAADNQAAPATEGHDLRLHG
jgi:hypothetical protein